MAGATHREPLGGTDGKSGSVLERVVVDGESLVLKQLHVDHDWTMRHFGDIVCRPVLVWTSGLLDAIPATIDHAVVGAAAGLGRHGWGGALLLRDVGPHLFPEGDDAVPLDHHRQLLDHLAELSAAFWGCDEDLVPGLVPTQTRYAAFNPAMLAVEEQLGWPDAVPPICADGWRRFVERAPADVLDGVQALRLDAAPLVTRLDDTPSTFLHGDWKLGNLGATPDGVTVLLDWTYPGVGPPLYELGWYLAINAARLPESKEEAIAALRVRPSRPSGIATDPWWDLQVDLCLLGTLVQFGWEKALGDGRRARVVVRAGPHGPGAAVSWSAADMGGAYGRAAEAWATGPARIYDELADDLVARSPVPLAGRLVADVGAGRGAATRAVARAGGRAVALDVAEGMLAANARSGGPPGIVADALALPIATDALDGVVAAFSYNHLTEPEVALAEAARVTQPGGVILASAYALDDDHPVKAAVDDAAMAAGWTPAPWLADLRRDAVPLLATEERAAAVAAAAGLRTVTVDTVEHAFPDLGPVELVEWRMGMATLAPFLTGLDELAQAKVAADARARLGEDPPVLVRPMIVLAAVV